MKRLIVTLSLDEKRAVTHQAKTLGLSRSTLMLKALTHYLKNHARTRALRKQSIKRRKSWKS
ncbi:ribbon-helix-helix protein, CopG family [Sulfurospirillum diekertiae]|uniref:ribbon-helix-helix protein, CopG family n=1 Tax=Sulfurospirillum diekertiae TaxID=1854492 RepID=UPI000B3B51D8|nr:ribbon-helix-helix protein, CopG family [Sulfurospirillum diekertiae]